VRKPIRIKTSADTIPASTTGAFGASVGGDSGSKPQISKPYKNPKRPQSFGGEAIMKEEHKTHMDKSGAADKGKARLRGVK